MGQAENSLTASNAEPTAPESVSDHAYGLARADNERCDEVGMDNDAGTGGHTLLSRTSPQQGRKSLFRR